MSERHLPFSFEKVIGDYPEKIVSAITEEEGILLTEIAIAKDKAPFSASKLGKALRDKGMIEERDGEISVTEEGMKAVSLFPTLGRNERRLSYPSAFFPFVLFEAASNHLPSGRWQKIISSDFFTSLFPGVDKERARQAGIKAVTRLIDLAVIIDDGKELALDRKAAKALMALSEEERIALMDTSSFPLEDKALFVYLASKLSAIEEEQLDDYFMIIEKLSNSSFDTLLLFLFSVLENTDGKITGRKIEECDTEGFTVSSDFSITYRGKAPEEIYLYAEPVLSDTTSEWKLTRLSMKTAFSASLTPDEIKEKIASLSSFRLPETLLSRISGWHESWEALKAERAIILRADERNARIIDALPTMQMHILSKIGENAFIMNPETEELWRRALQNAGFDMLGTTTGPQFQNKEEHLMIIPSSKFKAPKINEERTIPFRKEERQALLATTHDPWRRILINSGIIVDEAIKTPELETVNGLYYQEKMRIINHAIAEKRKLYLEFADGTVLTGYAEKTDEGFALSDKSFDADKVWKAGILPYSVIDSAEHPSDSDSQ